MNGSTDVSEIFRSLDQIALLQIGLIVAGAILIAYLSQRFLPWLANKTPSRFRLFLMGLVPVLRLLIIAITFALIIPRLIEPTVANMVTLFGALGLAVGFALKEYISSLIAGIVTLYEMPYRPGDWIEINGAYGEVKSINMRSLDIITLDDTVVVIPHIKLWDQLIFNANDGGQNLLCVADFYVHPRHDAAEVKYMLYDVALTSAFLQMAQPINVVVVNKPWATHYRLKAYPIDPRQQVPFITDLTVRGQATLAKSGVEFITAPTVALQK